MAGFGPPGTTQHETPISDLKSQRQTHFLRILASQTPRTLASRGPGLAWTCRWSPQSSPPRLSCGSVRASQALGPLGQEPQHSADYSPAPSALPLLSLPVGCSCWTDTHTVPQPRGPTGRCDRCCRADCGGRGQSQTPLSLTCRDLQHSQSSAASAFPKPASCTLGAAGLCGPWATAFGPGQSLPGAAHPGLSLGQEGPTTSRSDTTARKDGWR